MTNDSRKKGKDDLEAILRDAKDLHARASSKQTDSTGRSKHPSDTITSTIVSLNENLTFFRRLTYHVIQSYLGFHERIVAPAWNVIHPPLRFLFRWYGKLWARFVYRTHRTTGVRLFSRARAGVAVVLTLVVILALTPTRAGNAIRFFTTEPISDAFFILLSERTETFYLSHSEEIDPVGNVHAVRGCKQEGECSERDAAYFRVKPRLSHDIWKLITQGNPIYVPDHVVAPIAPGVNRCEVTYYGYRMTSSWISRLMRSLEVYPTMLEATCTYVGSGNSLTQSTAR